MIKCQLLAEGWGKDFVHKEATRVLSLGIVLTLAIMNSTKSIAGPSKGHVSTFEVPMVLQWRQCVSRQIAIESVFLGTAIRRIGARILAQFEEMGREVHAE